MIVSVISKCSIILNSRISRAFLFYPKLCSFQEVNESLSRTKLKSYTIIRRENRWVLNPLTCQLFWVSCEILLYSNLNFKTNCSVFFCSTRSTVTPFVQQSDAVNISVSKYGHLIVPELNVLWLERTATRGQITYDS